jgi:hypothetical protein
MDNPFEPLTLILAAGTMVLMLIAGGVALKRRAVILAVGIFLLFLLPVSQLALGPLILSSTTDMESMENAIAIFTLAQACLALVGWLLCLIGLFQGIKKG